VRECGSPIEVFFIVQVSGVEETVVYLTEDSELALGKSHLSSSFSIFLHLSLPHWGSIFLGIANLFLLFPNLKLSWIKYWKNKNFFFKDRWKYGKI
jgi:hypothetical protein